MSGQGKEAPGGCFESGGVLLGVSCSQGSPEEFGELRGTTSSSLCPVPCLGLGGEQGHHPKAQGSRCRVSGWLWLPGFLSPRRAPSPSSSSSCSWAAAGSFPSPLMRNSCTLSLETQPRRPRDCGEGLRLRLRGKRGRRRAKLAPLAHAVLCQGPCWEGRGSSWKPVAGEWEPARPHPADPTLTQRLSAPLPFLPGKGNSAPHARRLPRPRPQPR